MKKNALKSYSVKCLRKVEQDLLAYSKDKNPDTLHHLRVEIKKIKAICSFAGKIQGEKIDWAKLKVVFNHAGSIREQQIICKLLIKFDQAPEELITQIIRKEMLFQQRFLKNTPRYIEEVKSFREKFYLPTLLTDKKTISKFIKKRIRRAEKKMQGKNRKGLHLLRTKIKDIMYVYESLPESIQETIKLNTKHFDSLQQKLGNWHDTNSVIDFLSRQQNAEKLNAGVSKLKKKEEEQIKALFKDPRKLIKK